MQGNTGSCCVHITGGADIYLSVSLSIDPCVSCVCHMMCKCVISNQITSKNHVIHVKTSVILMPCYIKHTAKPCWY